MPALTSRYLHRGCLPDIRDDIPATVPPAKHAPHCYQFRNTIYRQCGELCKRRGLPRCGKVLAQTAQTGRTTMYEGALHCARISHDGTMFSMVPRFISETASNASINAA